MTRTLADVRKRVAATPSLRRDLEARLDAPDARAVVGHSQCGEVSAVVAEGRLQSLDISERLLFSSRAADVATSIVAAVHDALMGYADGGHHRRDELSSHQRTQETTELHHRILAREQRAS